MKEFVFLLLCVVGGIYAYKYFTAAPAPAPIAIPTPVATPTPAASPPSVDPYVGSRVRRMYEEWKDRTLATQRIQQKARRTDMSAVFTEVRKRLGDSGIHTPSAVKEAMVNALLSIGVPPNERDYVYSAMLGEAARDSRRAGHDKQN